MSWMDHLGRIKKRIRLRINELLHEEEIMMALILKKIGETGGGEAG